VIALREDGALGPEAAVHAERDAAGERADAVREGGGVLRLDDEVQVRSLDREVDDAEVGARRDRAERSDDDAPARRTAEAGQAGASPERHVDRETAAERSASHVGKAGLRAAGPAAGAGARSAPAGRVR